jgi:hypothetical protein
MLCLERVVNQRMNEYTDSECTKCDYEHPINIDCEFWLEENAFDDCENCGGIYPFGENCNECRSYWCQGCGRARIDPDCSCDSLDYYNIFKPKITRAVPVVAINHKVFRMLVPGDDE